MKRLHWMILCTVLAVPVLAQNTAIYLQGGSPILEGAAAAIKAASPQYGMAVPAGPVVMAGTKEKAAADLQDLKSKSVKYVYAIGTAPTALAAQSAEFGGVYVFVPNPEGAGLLARPRWAGVSPYPDPKLVMQYLRASMGLQKVAVLYTKKQNQEVAKVFQDAAEAQKVACVLVGLKESDELQSALDPALSGVQGVLLLIDSLAFSPDQLRFIVSRCLEVKKPLIGFLENMPEAGVPFGIFPPAEDLGKTAVAAMKALQEKGDDRKVWYAQRFSLSVNQAAVQSLGVPYDSKSVAKTY